jgi:hypothetical protein
MVVMVVILVIEEIELVDVAIPRHPNRVDHHLLLGHLDVQCP